MNSRSALRSTVLAAIAALALAACSSGTDGPPAVGEAQSPAVNDDGATTPEPDTANISLAIGDSDLGPIVTDGDGFTIYQYDADTQGSGESACSGSCLDNWPPVPGSEAPNIAGISGEVGTITGTNGNPQLTLNGWPLYYFAGDVNPGDINGEAVGGVWWVLSPAGEPIHN
jgi:predicted lipoprotein with Yx(FWY)xxD motif